MNKVNFKQSILAGSKASVVSLVVNSILFFTLKSLDVFTDNIFIEPNQPLSIFPIILSCILPSMIASIVFFLLEKYTLNGFKIFRIVALVLLILSFIQPFVGIAGATIAYSIGLNLMHLVVAGFVVYFIGKSVKKAN